MTKITYRMAKDGYTVTLNRHSGEGQNLVTTLRQYNKK